MGDFAPREKRWLQAIRLQDSDGGPEKDKYINILLCS
jgi:hypothetical protein